MRLKVAVFSKLFWPEGTGGELATYLIVKDVLSRYFDVTIVSGTERPARDILKCCRYIKWDVFKKGAKPLKWASLFANADNVRKLVEASDIVYIPFHTLLPIAVIVKALKPDIKVVLHLHNYQPLSYTSVFLSGRDPGTATDVIVERWEHDSVARAVAVGLITPLNKINVLALKLADRVICVSRRQCEIMTRYMPWLRRKAAVVYNPPPPISAVGKSLRDPPTFIYGGGGSFIKGIHILIKALRSLSGEEHFRFILYGAGFREKLIKTVRRTSSVMVEVLGRVPHERVRSLHEAAWASLFPSINEEPMPYAVVESMLLGTLPIASRAGGVPEILEGTVAERFLFEPGDVEAFVDKIKEVSCMSREEVVDVGLQLREHALKIFDIDKIRTEFIKVFLS